MRKAPGTRLVIAIISGVLSRRWFYHPALRIWKKTEQRQKVAEIIQVAEQLVLSRHPALTPRLSYSAPFDVSLTGGISGTPGHLMQMLIQTAQGVMVSALTDGEE